MEGTPLEVYHNKGSWMVWRNLAWSLAFVRLFRGRLKCLIELFTLGLTLSVCGSTWRIAEKTDACRVLMELIFQLGQDLRLLVIDPQTYGFWLLRCLGQKWTSKVSKTKILCTQCTPLHIHACVHIYTHTRTLIYTHLFIQKVARACLHACILTWIGTQMPTHIRIYVHIHMHAYVHTCIRTYIHACIHTYRHIYVHTYIHTHIQIQIHIDIHTKTFTDTYAYIHIRTDPYDARPGPPFQSDVEPLAHNSEFKHPIAPYPKVASL